MSGHRLAARRAELVSLSPQRQLSGLAHRFALLQARLSPALAARVELARSRFHGTSRALHAVSPLATLERGYAIALRVADGAILTDSGQAPPGTDVELRLSRGRLRARVSASTDD